MVKKIACPSCGKYIPSDALYCPKCASKVVQGEIQCMQDVKVNTDASTPFVQKKALEQPETIKLQFHDDMVSRKDVVKEESTSSQLHTVKSAIHEQPISPINKTDEHVRTSSPIGTHTKAILNDDEENNTTDEENKEIRENSVDSEKSFNSANGNLDSTAAILAELEQSKQKNVKKDIVASENNINVGINEHGNIIVNNTEVLDSSEGLSKELVLHGISVVTGVFFVIAILVFILIQ